MVPSSDAQITCPSRKLWDAQNRTAVREAPWDAQRRAAAMEPSCIPQGRALAKNLPAMCSDGPASGDLRVMHKGERLSRIIRALPVHHAGVDCELESMFRFMAHAVRKNDDEQNNKR